MDTSRFTDMLASDRAFYRPCKTQFLCNTDFGAFRKDWFHCSGPVMSVSHGISSKIDFSIVLCYKQVEEEKER